jgi:hypothetical protein
MTNARPATFCGTAMAQSVSAALLLRSYSCVLVPHLLMPGWLLATGTDQEDINFGDQYFWNHTNINASNYFVSSVVGSLSDSAVDGTFTDDENGVPQEHPKVAGAIGMSPAQLSELQRSTRSTHTRLLDALIKADKYNW